jgi:serine protease Do
MRSAVLLIACICTFRPLAAQAPTLADLSGALERVAARVTPAVVEIFATGLAPVDEAASVFGRRETSGSGVLIAPDGWIVTNAHVVGGADRVDVLLAVPAAPDAPQRSLVRPVGRRLPGRVVGIDLETDLALLKVEADGLPFLPLGDSDEVRPGQVVLAFGSPLGLEHSVTLGVVSAVGRQLIDDAPVAYIQTDAPINPGNSGGPLVNAEGALVGISTVILSQSGGSEGLGFAIPSNIVHTVTGQLRADGRVRRGVIGVRVQTITPALADGLRLARDWGVVVSDVYPRSPAAAAGLRTGDVIAALGGKPMENARQFVVNVYQQPIGGPVTLEVLRGPVRQPITVRVVERVDREGRFGELPPEDRDLVPALGVLGVTITDQVRPMLPWLRVPGGVLVAGRAASAGPPVADLAAGDVVLALNGDLVTTVRALSAGLAALPAGRAAVLHVDRFGELRYVVVRR